MAQIPTFFFSHARQDREAPGNYLRRFFMDLEKKLAQWAAIDLQNTRLGTIDARVPHGDNWDASLSSALQSNKVLVAILTPLYFNRSNCGKEMGVFLLRSPGLRIDANGALTGVRNVLLIRWLPEEAYAGNGIPDSLMPSILRLIEDTPADDGRDRERTRAIQRYRTKGLEKCITKAGYDELLDLFVLRIRDMPDLFPSSQVSFATANDAFHYDWNSYFASAGFPHPTTSIPSAPLSAGVPGALKSIVAFYVTPRQFTPDPTVVGFADGLIAETPAGSTPPDAVFNTLLGDVRAAGAAEGLSVFHAISSPVLPSDPKPLIDRLVSLSQSRVLTALIVDPAVWPSPVNNALSTTIEQIVRSPDWTGPVFSPIIVGAPLIIANGLGARSLPQRHVVLPLDSESRIALLRRAIVEARGRLLRTSNERAPNSEAVPILKGAAHERA